MGDYIGRLVYGEKTVQGFIPWNVEEEGRLIRLQPPKGVPEIKDVDKALEEAVSKSSTPAKIPALMTIIREHYKGGLVTIVVDDHTRPNVHTRLLLPRLLTILLAEGVERSKLRFVVAHGTHRPSREDESAKILGDEVWVGYRDQVEYHDCVKGVEVIGELDDGIPIELNRTVFSSEVVIGLSDLDYHYFAGVGGGPKQIVPGVSGRRTIIAEHLKMFGKIGFAEHVEMGVLDHNPVYECKRLLVEGIQAKMREKDSWLYAIVTVMDARGRLVHLVGGDVLDLHKSGESVLRDVNVASVERRADVVIISSRHLGIDLYQAGKAYNSARHAVKHGGRIVVLAPVLDRWGSEEYKGLMSVAAPVLSEIREKLKSTGGEDWEQITSAGIDRALSAVQEVVMRDFKIGKQKPVDLFVTLKHCGWGRLSMLEDGLNEEDKALLPIDFIGSEKEDPSKRLREWVERLEKETGGRLTYLLIEDPNLLVCM